MSKPTANWERVGNRFYRKVQLYTSVFNQDLDLQNYLVAEAPYSGAVGTGQVLSDIGRLLIIAHSSRAR